MKSRRSFPGERAVRIGLRTIHIGAASILYGAVMLGVQTNLDAAWGVAAGTGMAIMSDDLWRYGYPYLRSMMFWGILLKLSGLLVAAWKPSLAFYSLNLTLLLGSVISHMPGKFRYKMLWGLDNTQAVH